MSRDRSACDPPDPDRTGARERGRPASRGDLSDERSSALDADDAPPPSEGGMDPAADPDPVRLPIESVLDLHSFQPSDVASVVDEYLSEAVRAGFREVRIIHGRGIGVQREIVRAVLARSPFVVSFHDAPPEWGGWGATIAIVRS